MVNYQRLNVEVLFEDPILVIFRDFASQKEVTEFLADAKKENLSLQEVVDIINETTTEYVIGNDRIANGTFIPHEETTAIAKIFKKAKAMIPFVNFEYSEDWQILSYLPGGHYYPHYDYFEFESEAQWDGWMKAYGNRFATFFLVLQNAEKGGANLCYSHMVNYQRLNVEVLFKDPILVIFRDFASQKEVTEFLADARKENLSLQEVVDIINETTTEYVIGNDRIANGTFIPHEETTAIAKIFKKAKAMIPFVNFEYSEDWQVIILIVF
ncbi:unnamed protein product [Heligmosomoides polygyrus]|uniref:P4Hc domain-containing protein n=1 Tax=Heligmosomoides polygyrus TaxID=6339 RepID=A0A3P7ZEE7_HELPZ|nr:unnamed protein product [Heligmosomoides polygyrus]